MFSDGGLQKDPFRRHLDGFKVFAQIEVQGPRVGAQDAETQGQAGGGSLCAGDVEKALAKAMALMAGRKVEFAQAQVIWRAFKREAADGDAGKFRDPGIAQIKCAGVFCRLPYAPKGTGMIRHYLGFQPDHEIGV